MAVSADELRAIHTGIGNAGSGLHEPSATDDEYPLLGNGLAPGYVAADLTRAYPVESAVDIREDGLAFRYRTGFVTVGLETAPDPANGDWPMYERTLETTVRIRSRGIDLVAQRDASPLGYPGLGAIPAAVEYRLATERRRAGLAHSGAMQLIARKAGQVLTARVLRSSQDDVVMRSESYPQNPVRFVPEGPSVVPPENEVATRQLIEELARHLHPADRPNEVASLQADAMRLLSLGRDIQDSGRKDVMVSETDEAGNTAIVATTFPDERTVVVTKAVFDSAGRTIYYFTNQRVISPNPDETIFRGAMRYPSASYFTYDERGERVQHIIC